MLAMIILAAIVVPSLAFVAGALCGRAAGFEEGWQAASDRPDAEEIPPNATPFVRDAGLSRIHYDRP